MGKNNGQNWPKFQMFFIYFIWCSFFSGKRKKVPWLGSENKPKPWQPRNLQKYNKKKQKYNKKKQEYNNK